MTSHTQGNHLPLEKALPCDFWGFFNARGNLAVAHTQKGFEMGKYKWLLLVALLVVVATLVVIGTWGAAVAVEALVVAIALVVAGLVLAAVVAYEQEYAAQRKAAKAAATAMRQEAGNSD